MAYKKYIKRNGKVYGPYVYHSRRVNGKVVSEYRGQKKDINYFKIGYAFLGLFALVILLYGASQLDFNMSGQAILNLDAQYTEGEPIQGNLNLFAKQGELIPKTSKIIFETDTDYYEYILEDILTNEVVEGDYYIEGKNIGGQGLGYGIEGIGEIYPEVYFSLNILSSTDSVEEVVEENITGEIIGDEVEQEEQNQTEEPTESDSVIEEVEEPEIVEEEPAIEEEIAPLTGGVISNFFSRFTPTGKVTLEIENIIEGNVIYGEEYNYNLIGGQDIELIEGSVKTSSVDLEDNDINIDVVNGGVIVTTDYYEIERGFGEEYLGGDLETLNINLIDLNMVFGQGELRIRLVYGEEEITILTTSLVEEGSINAESVTKENVEEVNEIAQEGDSEVSVEEIDSLIVDEEIKLEGLPKLLTVEEKNILSKEFAEQKRIGITAEPVGEGKIKVRFGLGDYILEEIYSVSLSKEELALQMDIDQTEWLREIISSI